MARADESRSIVLEPSQAKRIDYVSSEREAEIRKDNMLRQPLAATFDFVVPEDGWYEFLSYSGNWPTIFYLDGRRFYYGELVPTVWEESEGVKLRNVFLKKGSHQLEVDRGWHPGAPGIRKLVFRPSQTPAGMVHLELDKDFLVFANGEKVEATLRAGRLAEAYTVRVANKDPESSKVFEQKDYVVPAGSGLFEETFSLPTGEEGIRDVVISDAEGNALDRTFQYLVINTVPPESKPWTTELVQEIDCTKLQPDFGNGQDKVVEANGLSYREAGPRGHMEKDQVADWFAYRLNLPEVQVPYLLEVDYADDDLRNWTYSIAEKEMPWGRTLTHGILSGGIYSLSDKMQTTQMVFYPRTKDPRVHFRNWWPEQPAAVSAIRVYRITGGFPPLVENGPTKERYFGRYQEEPGRFTQWGSRMEPNTWRTVWEPAERIGEYSRYVGANFWEPTISIYGDTLWPSRLIPGQGFNGGGYESTKEPVQRDTVRLLALVAGKYGMKFVGQLYPGMKREVSQRYFARRFTGDEGTMNFPEDFYRAPWVTGHRSGENKGRGGSLFLNPAYPGMQDWVADLITELADRYQDLPAMGGVAIRHMSWQFPGWQAWPNIEFGYDDWTVAQFQKDTGISVPGDPKDPKRFEKRYQWLTTKAYDDWVKWRGDQLEKLHRRLSKILTDRRPDWSLYIDILDPDFGGKSKLDRYEKLGWAGLLRETGIDPDRYRDNSQIVIRDWRHYPPGLRSRTTQTPKIQGAEFFKHLNPAPVAEAYRNVGDGTVTGVHFDANSYESDIAYGDELGFTYDAPNKKDPQGRHHLHGAGMVFPAGRHFLERYANAMADGNTVLITDGSHAYIAWSPQWLREWMPHYRALPNIGMTRLGTGDPVALWKGTEGGNNYSYVVNRLDCPVEVKVRFNSVPQELAILATGEAVKVNSDGVWETKLAPYELLSMRSGSTSEPQAMEIAVDPGYVTKVRKQIDTVTAWLVDGGKVSKSCDERTTGLAREQFERVRKAFDAGEYHAVRQHLLHPDLWVVFRQMNEYPEGLWSDR